MTNEQWFWLAYVSCFTALIGHTVNLLTTPERDDNER